MSLPDGSFSPQLWVARVISGGTYEYDQAHSQAGGSPPTGVSPSAFTYDSPANSRPGTAGYQPQNSPFSSSGYSPTSAGWSPGSAGYMPGNAGGGFIPRSPTHVYTPPPRTAAWETPRLPPNGYRFDSPIAF
jgi:hypothetical protein